MERRWRHVAFAGTYVEVGRGRMQSRDWVVGWREGDERVDMKEVVVYRSEKDCSLWVRPVEEFEDGRFVEIKP